MRYALYLLIFREFSTRGGGERPKRTGGAEENVPSYRAQADALEIEAHAKRRLAGKYDAAQDRGEIGRQGARNDLVSNVDEVAPAAEDVGLSRSDIQDAREIRDAEDAEPDIVRRAVDEAIEAGEEVTGKTNDIDRDVVVVHSVGEPMRAVTETFDAATNSSPWRKMDDFLARCRAARPITREEEAQLDKEFLEVLKRVNQRAVEAFKSAKAGGRADHP